VFSGTARTDAEGVLAAAIGQVDKRDSAADGRQVKWRGQLYALQVLHYMKRELQSMKYRRKARAEYGTSVGFFDREHKISGQPEGLLA
jgi:hypothetical protein